jgi:hypothetical protein
MYHRRSTHRGLSFKALPLVFAVLLQSPAAAAQSQAGLVGDAGFEEHFQSYYAALAGFGDEDLRRELRETIEDTLLTGGHLSQASLDDRVRLVEQAIFSQLRKQRCPPAEPPSSGLEAMKGQAAESVGHALEATGERLEPAEIGIVCGVVVRLLESSGPRGLCAGR